MGAYGRGETQGKVGSWRRAGRGGTCRRRGEWCRGMLMYFRGLAGRRGSGGGGEEGRVELHVPVNNTFVNLPSFTGYARSWRKH